MKLKATVAVLIFTASLLAQSAVSPSTVPVPAMTTEASSYGFQSGTVEGYVDGGGMHFSGGGGMYPAAKTGVDVGITKYIGFFGEGGVSRLSYTVPTYSCGYIGIAYRCISGSYKTSLNFYEAGAGLEVVGTNNSHFVPYAKLGMSYVWALGSGNPAILAAGGLRSYINHHVGIDAQLTVVRVLSRGGDATYLAPTVGVFFQSK